MTITALLSRVEPNGMQIFLGWVELPEGADLDAALVEICASEEVPGPPGAVASPHNHRLEQSSLAPSTFFKRCARPQHSNGFMLVEKPPGPLYLREEYGAAIVPHDAHALAAAMNQLSILVGDLREIFKIVEPNLDNMRAYGHQISNILILASMNFENECKGVLYTNGYVLNQRSNMTDYVKILPALRLDQYEIETPQYPSVKPRMPFMGWHTAQPTQSLAWYNAYNAVKHNRHDALNEATLSHAVDAVCACAIMIAAQYRVVTAWTDQIGGFFSFTKKAEWAFSEKCIPPTPPADWAPLRYSF